jgi:hypothetical protein
MSHLYDLVVLVADTDAEWTLRTLLEKRTDALQIRPLTSKVVRDPGRDAGVFLRAQDLLRPYVQMAACALVIFDREGSGGERRMSAPEMETVLEDRLYKNGWMNANQHPRAAVIVLDPELEVWAWSRSPHVPAALGLDQAQLEAVLQGFTRLPNGKPQRPKEAMLEALRIGKKPPSPDIFRELAQKVSLQAHERAFDKLRATLQTWFPAPDNSQAT